jgi:hypothetical protein
MVTVPLLIPSPLGPVFAVQVNPRLLKESVEQMTRFHGHLIST